MSIRKRLSDDEAKFLGRTYLNKKLEGRTTAVYSISEAELKKIQKRRQQKGESSAVKNTTASKTLPNDYKQPFVLSAWNKATGRMMDIDAYCEHYALPRKDISSYKLVSHTGTPFYNIVFKENYEDLVTDIDFEGIIKKHTKRLEVQPEKLDVVYDFDTLTYTDVHIGMDTDKDSNSMYAEEWNRDEIIKTASAIVNYTLSYKNANVLVVDDLGDLLDGLNARTTRGGHDLPQNMTNEEAFDCALMFKSVILDGLVDHYTELIFNNVCNDNHAGSFGYFVNRAFKQLAELKYSNVKVRNHRTFLSHYFVNDIAFVISHGKDDKTLKFGFKPVLDTKQIEKIDQYCKHNNLYAKAKRIVFKKGDSHQAILDMATSDDFDYFNYPAASPSSQWIQNNFKKGRRGVILESYKGLQTTFTPIFF